MLAHGLLNLAPITAPDRLHQVVQHVAAVTAAQTQETVGQDAASEEGVEHVLHELRQVGAGGGLGFGEESRGVLLHQAWSARGGVARSGVSFAAGAVGRGRAWDSVLGRIPVVAALGRRRNEWPVCDELLTYAGAACAIPHRLSNECLLLRPANSRIRPRPAGHSRRLDAEKLTFNARRRLLVRLLNCWTDRAKRGYQLNSLLRRTSSGRPR